VIWGAIAVWSHEQSELERLYLGDYLRVTLMPDFSSVTKLLAFGPHKPPRTDGQVLICYTIRGQEIPAVGELKPIGEDASHPARDGRSRSIG